MHMGIEWQPQLLRRTERGHEMYTIRVSSKHHGSVKLVASAGGWCAAGSETTRSADGAGAGHTVWESDEATLSGKSDMAW